MREIIMTAIAQNRLALFLMLACCLSSCEVGLAGPVSPVPTEVASAPDEWTEDFHLASRHLRSTGASRFFNLTPGHQSILASAEGKLTITVLEQTKEIGGITTRVVEEREESNGALSEISRNYYAIDGDTGDVFYFGEEVDLYSNGQITGHGGAWLAYENGNRPGLIMPGAPTVGMKYYQELAPAVAADRARVISVTERISTQAGDFEDCLLTEESSKIEPAVIEHKTYCPKVGLVQDESLTLVSDTSTGTSTQP